VYPLPHERDRLGEVRWVFDPYLRARPSLPSMTGATMREVIRDVHHRLGEFVIGRAEIMPIVGQFTPIGGGDGWMFAEVTHQTAREKMVSAGVRAAVELFGRHGDRFLYTVWRRSEYVIGFPVKEILAALNVAEGFQPVDTHGWGGADSVGGSPRGRGSALPPDQVEAIVNEIVSRCAQR
jgi:hypothetical protein